MSNLNKEGIVLLFLRNRPGLKRMVLTLNYLNDECLNCNQVINIAFSDNNDIYELTNLPDLMLLFTDKLHACTQFN